MSQVRDRPSVASASMLLFVATLLIVFDLRVPDVDIVADAAGGVLVVIASLRIHGAIMGADGLRTALVVLALLALPVTFLETLTPATGEAGLLGISQLIGTAVLARLLGDALERNEPDLAATWRTCSQLIIWLSIAPLVIGVLIGRLGAVGTTESPLALVLLVVLAIPLLATLMALWRTGQVPPASSPASAP
ncbi:MAG TPA: hypothetical protein VFP30_05260 [Candidatus Limnocylindria bacterium]|nr:hypothetical protein [Candidatus Limnocylindria bacterium]